MNSFTNFPIRLTRLLSIGPYIRPRTNNAYISRGHVRQFANRQHLVKQHRLHLHLFQVARRISSAIHLIRHSYHLFTGLLNFIHSSTNLPNRLTNIRASHFNHRLLQLNLRHTHVRHRRKGQVNGHIVHFNDSHINRLLAISHNLRLLRLHIHHIHLNHNRQYRNTEASVRPHRDHSNRLRRYHGCHNSSSNTIVNGRSCINTVLTTNVQFNRRRVPSKYLQQPRHITCLHNGHSRATHRSHTGHNLRIVATNR